MGACASQENRDPQAERLHREAEKLIKENKQRLDAETKVLLLGPGDSGKSTVLKQMRIIHDVHFSRQEIEGYRQLIFSNLVLGMGAVLMAMDQFQMKLSEANMDHLYLIDEPANVRDGEPFPRQYYQPLLELWNDPAVKIAYQRANEIGLPENLPYLFSDLPRLFHPSYVPTEQDILRARARTTGITETVIRIKHGRTMRVMDVGGQKSERRKWIHCFEDVTTVLFLVSLSGYDAVLGEDLEANQMMDALTIWDSICNSQWFKKTPLVLFLNKNDLFEEKIRHSDIKDHFAEYDGAPGSASEGREFFKQRFLRLHLKAKVKDRKVYSHFTTATDTTMIKVVMSAVEAEALQSNLRELDLM